MTDSSKEQEQELVRSAVSGQLRSLILELWQQIRIDWGFATDKLSTVFRRERSLGSQERRFVAEVLYDMIRHARRIDAALSAGGHKSVGRAPDYKRLLACLILQGTLTPAEASQQESGIDWAKVAGIDAKLDAIRNPVERIAVRHSLPDFLAKVLVADLGAERASDLAAALNIRAPMTLRANTLKGTRDELIAALSEEGIETSEGNYGAETLQVGTRTNLFGLEAFQKGLFEAQDEGSQLIGELVAPPPKSLVIDYCAGAGGKSLALAAMLGNRGRIVACDVNKRKLKEMRRRAKRAGVGNIQVVELSPEMGVAFPAPLEKLISGAARVLVDAPCTGIGALRRNPEARWRLSEDDLTRLPKTQLGIAQRALELVSPGGRLIYATCTLLKRENEGVVDGLLEGRDDLEIISPREVWGAERGEPLVDPSKRFLLTSPDRHGTDGFFAAVIRRKR